MTMLTASCHCGAVQLEITREPKSLTECNCSICRRIRALWAYYTQNSVRITAALEALAAYTWGDKTIEFFHCKSCGCTTHYESMEKTGNSRMAVNARMMQSEDIASVRIRKFDGAVTWKYIDE